jgi:hypothetical protein
MVRTSKWAKIKASAGLLSFWRNSHFLAFFQLPEEGYSPTGGLLPSAKPPMAD